MVSPFFYSYPKNYIYIFTGKKNKLIEIECFKILHKPLFIRATFEAPFRAYDTLENEARFVFISKGNSRLYTPKGRIDFTKGDCLLMNSENFVNQWYPSSGDSSAQIISIRVYPDVLKYVYDNQLPEVFSPSNTPLNEPFIKVQTNQAIKNYIGGLTHYFDEPRYMQEELLISKIREFIFLLSKLDDNNEIQLMLKELFQTKKYQFKEVIQKNLYENLSINELAYLCGMSLSSFQREFKKLFGTSPAKFIRKKRIEKAKKLLNNPDYRISDIAYEVGFESVSHFSKVFSAISNMSPTQYQKTKK